MSLSAMEFPLGDDWEPTVISGRPLTVDEVQRLVANTFACSCGFSNPRGYPAVTRMHVLHHELEARAVAAIEEAAAPPAAGAEEPPR